MPGHGRETARRSSLPECVGEMLSNRILGGGIENFVAVGVRDVEDVNGSVRLAGFDLPTFAPALGCNSCVPFGGSPGCLMPTR